MRLEAAPPYLRGRVLRDEELPQVEVSVEEGVGLVAPREPAEGEDEEGGKDKDEELRAVARHVLEQLKAELVVELMEAIRPGWSEGKATWLRPEEVASADFSIDDQGIVGR